MPTVNIQGLIERLVDPTGKSEAVERILAPRLRDLDGAVIGLLDNRKGNGDHILDGVAEGILQYHPSVQITRFKKRIFSRPAEPEVMAALRECSAVIEAIGD